MPESQHSDFEGLRAIVEAAKMNADRAYRVSKSVEAEIERTNRHSWPFVVVCCFAIGLAAGGYWLSTVLNHYAVSIARLERMQTLVTDLDQRLNSAEAVLKTQRPDAAQPVGPVNAPAGEDQSPEDKKPANNPETQRASLEARVALLQRQHEADAREITSLESNLSRVQGQRQLPSTTASAGTRIESPPANRMDFQILEGKTGEVVPGVLLAIKEIDAEKQEVNGWIYLQNEHRFLQLNNHGLFQPVTVRGMYDQQNHEIVLTRIRRTDVMGYVSPPATVASRNTGD